jgi:spermidine/putrescine transport system ATP-binding protein
MPSEGIGYGAQRIQRIPLRGGWVSEAGSSDRRGDGDVIVLDAVAKRFQDFVAVHLADFGIQSGEFFSMLGPSGCGKTTTLRMIAGFESPSEGRILLDGEDVSRTPPYRRNVNTVFQQYALFPHMTVAENVAFGLKSKKVEKSEITRRVDEILGTVRMTQFADRRPTQLSGGQQQRVALARALVNRPSALLLDEPLAALDLKLRQVMQLELKEIQRETGVTFVFVTHDQQEALTMSDRIAVMSEGRVEQIGSPDEIYHAPATAFVAGFIGEANLIGGTVASVSGSEAVVEADGTRLSVPAPDRGVRAGDQVLVMIRPERVRVVSELGPGEFGLAGTVTELIFRGPSTRVEMATASGSSLVAHLVDGKDAAAFRPGDTAHAVWDPSAAYLVAGSDTLAKVPTADPDTRLDPHPPEPNSPESNLEEST